MAKPLPALLLLIGFAMTGGPAQSRSLQVVGTAGYLSEWELTGSVTERKSAAHAEFSGPVTWKHVGLCSVNGPQEKSGQIRFQLSPSGASSHIDATISLDDAQCRYSGDFAGSSNGHMDCSDAKGVPISISIK